MAKAKFDETTRKFLHTAYVDAVEEFGGAAMVTAKFNELFFIRMTKTEALGDFTAPQMRGSLIIADLYVATAPRMEPKKKGVTKKDLVAKLEKLAGVELTSGMKLVMSDLEALIAALTPVEE